MSEKNFNRIVIVNRTIAPRPGWIHIVPKGEIEHKASGTVQLFDDQALDAIWNRLEELQKDPNWEGLYAGREHFIYDEGQDSAALAWFKHFDRDANGIWANEDGLTASGKSAHANKDYKFTSPVIDGKDMQKLEGSQRRPLAIETVGFTNYPNAKAFLAPISNRAGLLENFAGSGEPADKNEHQTKGKKMKAVLTELGLSADASEDSALAAVIKLKNRNTTLEPLEAENLKLKNRVTDLDAQNVDSLLAARGVTDEKVLNRLKPVLAKMETVADRVGFLDDCDFKVQETAKNDGKDGQKKLFNRDGKAPNGEKTGTEAQDAKAEKASADKIMNRAREMMKETPNLKLPTAVRMAKREMEATA